MKCIVIYVGSEPELFWSAVVTGFPCVEKFGNITPFTWKKTTKPFYIVPI